MADRGEQTFTYALYSWVGSFADSNVVREAYELNVPVTVVPGAGGDGSLFSLNAPISSSRRSSQPRMVQVM